MDGLFLEHTTLAFLCKRKPSPVRCTSNVCSAFLRFPNVFSGFLMSGGEPSGPYEFSLVLVGHVCSCSLWVRGLLVGGQARLREAFWASTVEETAPAFFGEGAVLASTVEG